MTDNDIIKKAKSQVLIGGIILALPVLYDFYRGSPSFFVFILAAYLTYYFIKIPLIQSDWMLNLKYKYELGDYRKFPLLLIVLTLIIVIASILAGTGAFIAATKLL